MSAALRQKKKGRKERSFSLQKSPNFHSLEEKEGTDEGKEGRKERAKGRKRGDRRWTVEGSQTVGEKEGEGQPASGGRV